MKRVWYMALICVVILSLFSSLVLYASAYGRQAHLMVVEWYGQGRGRVILYSIPSEDDSMTNPDYELLPSQQLQKHGMQTQPSSFSFSKGQRVRVLEFETNTMLLLGDYIQIQTR
jgi:hypothetical protein